MADINTLRIAAVNTYCIDTSSIAGHMVGNLKADRLRDARQKAGFSSAAEAAQRFEWSESAYRHHENGTRNFGPDAAKRYARAFRVKPGWLLGLEMTSDLPPGQLDDDGPLIVNGSVAAGVWRESEHWNDDRRFVIRLPSPIPGAKRFGLVVEGYSMDEFYAPGVILDCISIFSNGTQPTTGDHVIVERTRPDGLREITIKEYREEQGRFLLVPRSSKEEFKAIEYAGPDAEPDAGAEGEIVQVIAFVVASYPPRAIELMRRMGLVS